MRTPLGERGGLPSDATVSSLDQLQQPSPCLNER